MFICKKSKKGLHVAAGFIYVLVNSSMPGLVKVGKTTRSPSDRGSELSGVTGVATPFIVAYEDYFNDCDAAEQFVHSMLTEKGMRVSESREFFRAPVSDVVRIITSMPGSITYDRQIGIENERLSIPNDRQFHSDSRDKVPAPWDEMLRRADNYLVGYRGCLKDYAEAMKLYTDAARLGSELALESLGNMYLLGRGVRANADRALELFKESVRKGNFYCYVRMTELYI